MAFRIIEKDVLSQGNSINLLSNLINSFDPINNQLGANDNVELELVFSSLFPDFSFIAQEIEYEMERRDYKKWDGANSFVYIEPSTNTYYIRWKHGNPVSISVLLLITGILASLALIAIILYQLSKVFIDTEISLPRTINTLMTGTLIVAGLYFISQISKSFRGRNTS